MITEDTDNCDTVPPRKKGEWIKEKYRKIRSVFESSARQSLERMAVEHKEKYAAKLVSHYRNINAWLGVVGPILVSLLFSIYTKPDASVEKINIVIYYIIIIGSVWVCIFLFTITFLQKDVWEAILSEYDMNQQEIIKRQLSEEKKKNEELIFKTQILEDDKNRLLEFKSVTALLESNRNRGKNIQSILLQRILTVLGNGEYSVALYHSYDREYVLDEYESTRIKLETPTSLKKLLKKDDNENKYKSYYSAECLFEEKNGRHCKKNREEIKDSLKGNIKDINQYACYNYEMGKTHNILLEIIAYNDTKFSYEDDDIDGYFDKIFGCYMPLIEMFVGSVDVQQKFRDLRA
ncbi:hypothetical protein KQI22_08305 [Kineothrix sp. MSJ-39]|uniref:hypothetical protein n=1 Tax=Kineothrix sp. MSJ-39 TaxID=2841533 RepID=UPI001C103EF5|nr:hypothetical protein [Kineothrix sp. MSJ-39]MBU5430059.1 hypothetical protein [Kineothrix sp. MSJ-39]